MYKYPLIIFLLLFSCENPLTDEDDINCVLDYNGFYDNCEICSGGTSGHIANSEQDCNGICNGTSILDGCGVCDGDNTSCDNTCSNFDCNGDCDDVDTGVVIDECGICNGNNLNKDLCGICFGDNNTCNTGLLTLAVWNFKEMHFWDNQDCSGFPYSSFFNEICLNDDCYNYEINFYFDTYDGYLKFDQTNILWSHSNPENVTEKIQSGFWYFENTSSLCLDYSDDMLIDGCYESVEFDTIIDCELNPENCITKMVSFINFEEDSNTCTIENYNSISSNQQSSSDNINLEYSPFSFKNSLTSFNKLK